MSEKTRGFEIISEYEGKGLKIPVRATKNAAGYDFEAAQNIMIKCQYNNVVRPILIPTGIKAYMPQNEFLLLANRSGNPMKRGLILANSVGVIDADYYNNPSNEGHIMFQFINQSGADIMIKKGERIGQGIFLPFLLTDNDTAATERTGGFGSTSV